MEGFKARAVKNISIINLYRKYQKLIENILLGAVFTIFIGSMVPIYLVGRYDRIAIDDYAYGEYAHFAWVNTHSIIEVLKAACHKVYEIYYSWQGTWFSVFLFGLHPAVFHFDAYAIVPYLMTGIIIITMSFFLFEVLVKHFGMTNKQYLICDLLLLFLYMQFEPYTYCAIYWWVGSVHYIIPLAVCFIAFTLTSRFLRMGHSTQFIGICICAIIVSGTNYLAAFFLPLGAFLLILSYLFSNYKREDRKVTFTWKRIYLFLIPLFLEFIGMLISVLAPGNFVRKNVDLSVGAYFAALGKSIMKGTASVFEYLVSKPITSVVLLILAAIIWYMLCVNKADAHKRCKHPVLFVLYVHFARCLVYWPEFFSGDSVSGGVYNMYYQVYVLCAFLCILYLLNWLYGHLHQKSNGKITPDKRLSISIKLLTGSIICGFVIVILMGKSDMKSSAAYTAYDMLRSGRAVQYSQIAALQNDLLEYATDDVVTVPIQGEDYSPFIYSTPTENPEDWQNKALARYYNLKEVYGKPKDSVN